MKLSLLKARFQSRLMKMRLHTLAEYRTRAAQQSIRRPPITQLLLSPALPSPFPAALTANITCTY
eukprot:5323495-Pleurochrysis_carterae.AAC.3